MPIEPLDISHETIGKNCLLYPMLRKLRVSEIINSHCPSEGEIPVGCVAEAIILSRFSDKRVPMYKLNEFCKSNGIGTIYSIDSEKMNDDRTGRALDAMHESLSNIKAQLIVGVTKEFDMDLTEIHTDITNILFEGKYEGIEDEQLQVTYGHTKKGQDSRCKQVNFSLSVTADGGVPLWYEALNGNTNDSICYLPHLSALSDSLGITSPLIVGDSKLVSNNNMIAFCRSGASFIGPASLDKNEKKRLMKLWEEGVPFQTLRLKEEDNHPFRYWGMETERKITDEKEKKSYTIRHLYIFSRQRREVIRHTKAKKFTKAKAALHKIIRCLNKYDYKTERTIHSRLKSKVLSKCPYYKIKLTKNEVGLFEIEYKIDWDKLHLDEIFDGIYVLRCNLTCEYSITDVLCSYKRQSMIERSFESIKQPPISVSPVWLQNPKRIESLLFCVFVAFLVMALLEREARKKIAPKGIPLRVEGRDKLPLTASVLLEAFDNIALYTITQKVDGKIITNSFCTNLSIVQRDVLFLLSFPSFSEWLAEKKEK
jgi:transposase